MYILDERVFKPAWYCVRRIWYIWVRKSQVAVFSQYIVKWWTLGLNQHTWWPETNTFLLEFTSMRRPHWNSCSGFIQVVFALPVFQSAWGLIRGRVSGRVMRGNKYPQGSFQVRLMVAGIYSDHNHTCARKLEPCTRARNKQLSNMSPRSKEFKNERAVAGGWGGEQQKMQDVLQSVDDSKGKKKATTTLIGCQQHFFNNCEVAAVFASCPSHR